jgi:PIN domain nuclease of toxin-antitoxin system
MNYLVDTCVLLWLTGDPSKLPAPVRRVFGPSGGVIHVSAISAFELGIIW